MDIGDHWEFCKEIREDPEVSRETVRKVERLVNELLEAEAKIARIEASYELATKLPVALLIGGIGLMALFH